MMEHLSLVPYEGGSGGGAGGGGGDAKYKECMRNHAAAMGGQAFDGCGEFMPDAPGDSLKCAACGCHRSFHRRAAAAPGVFFRPPPPPLALPPPPPPPSSQQHSHVAALQSFLPSAPPPHLALPYHAVPAAPWSVMRAGSETPPRPEDFGLVGSGGSSGSGGMGRKRFRTKFTPEQKERMREFAEKQGWRINRNDDGALERFCHEIGVRRQVLKVWMHNHKNHNNSGGGAQKLADHHHSLDASSIPASAGAMGGVPGATAAGPGMMINPGAGTGTGINPGMGGGDDDDDDDTDDSPPRAAVSSPSPSPISV